MERKLSLLYIFPSQLLYLPLPIYTLPSHCCPNVYCYFYCRIEQVEQVEELLKGGKGCLINPPHLLLYTTINPNPPHLALGAAPRPCSSLFLRGRLGSTPSSPTSHQPLKWSDHLYGLVGLGNSDGALSIFQRTTLAHYIGDRGKTSASYFEFIQQQRNKRTDITSMWSE